MKLTITVLLFIFTFLSHADELRLGTMINYHIFYNLPELHNKITSNGRAVSSPIFAEYQSKNFSTFVTTECMGQLTVGLLSASRVYESERNTSSIFVGGYFIQTKKWVVEANVNPYWLDVSDKIGLTPIVGIKNDFKIYKEKTFSFDLTTVATPAILQAGLFFNFKIP